MAEYPTSVVEQLVSDLDAGLPADTVVDYYAGEFFDLDQLERIRNDVRNKPMVFVDLDTMTIPAEEESDRSPNDRLQFAVYACASNLRSESRQQQMSYELANKARKILVGSEVGSTPGVHSNGFIKYAGIIKEHQDYGLSVHNLIIFTDLHYDLDS